MIDTMVWHEGVSHCSWVCNPTEELRYMVTDITEAHKKKKVRSKYKGFIASVGIIITDADGNAVSERRMWLDLEFIMDSNRLPQVTTSTLDSAFRICAADFAARIMKHKIA